MKRFLLLLLSCFVLHADLDAKEVKVKGYYRKDGTYVRPHTRSSSNSTKSDNYSTRSTPRAGGGSHQSPAPAPYVAPSSGNSDGYYVNQRALVEQHIRERDSAPSAAKQAAMSRAQENWSKLKAGMNEKEVHELLGAPNIQTTRRWVYSGTGTVIFDAKGLTQ